MHQRRGLQRLPWTFLLHMSSGKPSYTSGSRSEATALP